MRPSDLDALDDAETQSSIGVIVSISGIDDEKPPVPSLTRDNMFSCDTTVPMTGNPEVGHKILEILYQDHFGDDDTNLDSSDIAGRLEDIDESQVNQILGNLHQAELLEKPTRIPKLTSKGISVVLEQREREARAEEREDRAQERKARDSERDARQEDREEQIKINRSIQYLTVALVLAGGFQGVTRNLQYFSEINRFIYSVAGAVGVFVIMVVLLIIAKRD